jgi:uncharacterized FlaG/YvyC family protein
MTIETTSRISVSLLSTWPVRVGQEDGARFSTARDAPSDEEAASADEAAAAVVAQAKKPLIAGHLRIELDRDAGRFVQTLTDPQTNEILRRFPNESQLAFARAIGAYMNARLGRS